MEDTTPVALNLATLGVIGALIGSLAGAISGLFRLLVKAKDAHILAVTRDMELQRTAMLGQIDELKADRDYFRSMALRDRGIGRRAARTEDDDDENGGPPPGVRRVR